MNKNLLEVKITPREEEVVNLLSRGFTSKKIAAKMGVSFHTVENFRKNLMKKFRAGTTVEMVLKARNLYVMVLLTSILLTSVY